MKKWSVLLLLSIVISAFYSDTTFYSLEAAKRDPITVEYLILQKKKMTKYPDSLFIFQNLLELDLSKNKIDLIGPEIGELPPLFKLNLHGNELSRIPPQIGKVKSLRELDLSKNKIKFLPETIGELQDLEVLRVYANPLEDLPSGIFQLNNLKEIDLRQMDLPKETLITLRESLPEVKILYSKDCGCGI